MSGEAGNLAELKPGFLKHKKHLDSLLPDILRCPYIAAGEKVRAVLFIASPTLTWTAARAWGRLCRLGRG